MKHIEIVTNKGSLLVELDDVKAPLTVQNFLAYMTAGHYTDTIFHRVISKFMIQGGGFDANMHQKPADATVENEAKNGLKNDKYTIAMARTSAPHSAGAQFFINTKNNDFLNYPGQDGWGYAVFGKVVAGESIVDEIDQVITGRVGMFADVPKDPIVILEIKEVESPAAAASAVADDVDVIEDAS